MSKQMSGREGHYLRILRKRAFDKQRGICHWCGEAMKDESADRNDPLRVTADHLVPIHNGGRTVPGNIVAAHPACNSHRHAELCSLGGGLVYADEDKPRSPFEALRT